MWNKNKTKFIYKNRKLSTEIFHTYYPKPQERQNKVNFLAGKQVEILQELGPLPLISQDLEFTKNSGWLVKGEK